MAIDSSFGDERTALVRGILEAPFDPLPRLVLADWYEEREEWVECFACSGRGEREDGSEAGCNYCKGDGWRSNGCADHAALLRLPAGGADAMQRTHRTIHESRGLVEFIGYHSRGFVEAVRCYRTQWLDIGPACVAEHPIVRVELSDTNPCDEVTDAAIHHSPAFRWFEMSHGENTQMEYDTHENAVFQMMWDDSLSVDFDSAEAAHAALSRAALDWARRVAGLPAIVWE